MVSSNKKIAIFSKGRSHLWDLFLSMNQLSADVTFYSDVPKARLKQFGYNHQNIHSYFLSILPFLLKSRTKLNQKRAENNNRLWIERLDKKGSDSLEPCDLFIGLSGICNQTLKTARKKYGSKIWIERGSVHILTQQNILAQMNTENKPAKIPNWAIERELESYELADRIVVPSMHVAESFYQNGFNQDKLFINGYGTDLTSFPATKKPELTRPTLIFVGGWTLRKGCDYLNKLLAEHPELDLIHLGNSSDCPLPVTPNFKSFGHVIQNKLTEYYAKAHILVHPSREEGMSLVLAQALASGLPIVCSPLSGGADLKKKLHPIPAITVLTELSVENIYQGILEQMNFARNQTSLRDLLGDKRLLLSWNVTAKNYLAEINRMDANTQTVFSPTGSGQ